MAKTSSASRIVLLLDLYESFSRDEWLSPLGPEPGAPAHVITLTECGASRRPGPEPEHGPIPWRDLGRAVDAMADRALALAAKAGGPVELYVGGLAYLCLFTHLGYRLSSLRGHRLVLLGRRHDHGPLEPFDLRRPLPPQGVLTVRPDLSAVSRAGGVVVACVNTMGVEPQARAEKAVEGGGLHLAGTVEMATPKPGRTTLTPETLPGVAAELKAFFSGLPSAYPRADTLALFVAGPTLLAFLVGQAINPTVRAHALQLTNHHQGIDSLTYRLPLAPAGADGPAPFDVAPIRVLFLAANPGLTSTPRDGNAAAVGRDLSAPAGAASSPTAPEGPAPPSSHAPLDLEREARDIEAALKASERGARFELKTAWAVRARDLRRRLEEHRPHIVHISCHGAPAEGLVLLDDDDRPAPVRPGALRRLFEFLRDDPRTGPPDDVRLVVLNACWSAEQAKALAEIVGCAIGMPSSVNDATAVEFAAELYAQLATGKTIRQAFEGAKTELDLRGHAGAHDAKLFEPGRGAADDTGPTPPAARGR